MSQLSTIQRIAAIVAVAALVLTAASSVLNSCEDKKRDRVIKQLESRKAKILDADSLRDAIESRILDSLNKRVDRQDAKIAENRKIILKTRRQNELLQNRFDSIRVFMPPF